MDKVLIAGIVCIIAAIVGGGLKAFGIEMPVLTTPLRQLGLGAFGIVLMGIALVFGAANPGKDGRPAVVEAPPAAKEASTLTLDRSLLRTASWVDQSPIAVAPVLLHCDCLDSDAQNPATGQWERLSRGGHSYQKATKLRFTNQCPISIQLFTVRDTLPDAVRVPIVEATAGRSYSLETLNTGDRVIYDPYSGGPASVGFMPINCPPAFARLVPLNCVSDARISPGLSPPGPPTICAAQGPANTTCSCNGRQGINFLGEVPAYP